VKTGVDQQREAVPEASPLILLCLLVMDRVGSNFKADHETQTLNQTFSF